MTYPTAALKDHLDTLYPTFGSYGYAALLDADLNLNLGYSVDITSDLLTTITPHGLVTGTRVRSTATVAQPGISPSGTLSSTVDYFVRVVSTTELELYSTLNDATNATNQINFTGTGTGTLELNEQALNAEDPIEVLVNHELDHPDYTRFELESMNPAFASAGEGRKNSDLWTMTANTTSPAWEFLYVLIIKNGSSAIGDTNGSIDNLDARPSLISIPPGDSASYTIQFSNANP
jgi:hypothetical protein